MSICPHCQHQFETWVDYQEHVNLNLCKKVIHIRTAPVKPIYELVTAWRPKLDARGMPVYEPMDLRRKMQIVRDVEVRLAKHIIGG